MQKNNQLFIVLLFLIFTHSVFILFAQETHFNPNVFSLMLVPINLDQKISDTSTRNKLNDREAMLELIKYFKINGFTNIIDYSTNDDVVKERIIITNEQTKSNRIKTAIQNAPVDVLIQVEVSYIEPNNLPQNKQVFMNLKAIDRYNAVVYASTSSIVSKQRNFVNFQKAIATTLEIDGASAFNNFIEELKEALKNVSKEGRLLKMKFEIAKESKIQFFDKIGTETLADKIEKFIKNNALNGEYQIPGQSSVYLDFSFRMATSESKEPLNMFTLLRGKLQLFLEANGVELFETTIIGSWINCIIK